MLPIASALLFWSVGQTTDVEIPVTHVRASKLAQRLLGINGSLPGLTLTADDEHGVIHAGGSPDEVKSIRSMVEMLDVPVRQVHITMVIDSPADHIHKTVQTEVSNDTDWSFEDGDLQTKMKIRIRFNDDGTLTESVTSAYAAAEQKVVMRLAQSQTGYFRPGYFASINDEVKRHLDQIAELDAKCVPTIRLKAEWLDGK